MQFGGRVPGWPSAPASHKGGGLRGRNDGAGFVSRSARIFAGPGKIAGWAVGTTGAGDQPAYRQVYLVLGFNFHAGLLDGGRALHLRFTSPAMLNRRKTRPPAFLKDPFEGKG